MGGIESKNDRQDDPRIEVADFDFDFRDEEDFPPPRQRFVNPEHERHINRVNGCSLRRIFYNGWPLPSAGEAFGLTSSPPPPRRWRHYDDDGGFLHHSSYLGKMTRDEISVETAQDALEYDRIYINVVKTPVRENRHVSRACAVNNNMAASHSQPGADAASSNNAGGSGSSGNASSGRREQQQLPEKDRQRQRIRFRETNW
jgi:hypothetical protein